MLSVSVGGNICIQAARGRDGPALAVLIERSPQKQQGECGNTKGWRGCAIQHPVWDIDIYTALVLSVSELPLLVLLE